ncbi:unnamed protein product [Angiostrongylus costaricensis]|uniref:BED-type domain-containing protein n=1 Tax=Angiostrongylus costaricensis TaxID=334426 RepID=A0A0R3PK22_ANGCS|nr:unnamed protein product [Angiostrongylus costaricensis]
MPVAVSKQENKSRSLISDKKYRCMYCKADDREAIKEKGGTDSGPITRHDHSGWHKAAKVDSPTVTTTLKNLGARRGNYEAEETLEDVALRAKKAAGAVSTIC